MPSEEKPAATAAAEPNDYLLHLIEAARRHFADPHNTPMSQQLRECCPDIADDILNLPETRDSEAHKHAYAELVTRIAEWPRFQERLGFAINYPPSKWLLEKEQPYLQVRRQIHGLDCDDPTDQPYRWAAENQVQGICLSGGGIRSATFNLGVLQGLARLDLLKNFDYLSSVSGGGYIHQFLAAWIKREEERNKEQIDRERREQHLPEEPYVGGAGFRSVNGLLDPLPNREQAPFHPEPIKWLRRYSNYLTPQKGMFSADMWVMVAIWLRNTFLNQIVLLSGLLLAVLLLRWFSLWLKGPLDPLDLAVTVGGLFLIVAIYLGNALHGEYVRIRQSDMQKTGEITNDRAVQPGWILGENAALLLGVVPFLIAAFLSLNTLLAIPEDAGRWAYLEVFAGLLLFVLVVAVAGGAGREHALSNDKDLRKNPAKVKAGGYWLCIYAATVAAFLGASAFAGVWWLLCWLNARIPSMYRWEVLLVIGPPLLFSLPFLTLVFGAGLVGRDFTDWMREWLARLRAWSLLLGLFWLGALAIALLGPFLVDWLAFKSGGWIAAIKWSSVAVWAGTTAGSLLASKSSKTAGKADNPTAGWLDLLAAVGPYIYILGLLVLLSWCGRALVTLDVQSWVKNHASVLTGPLVTFHVLSGVENHLTIFLVLLATAFLFFLFGWRVDINVFSLNSFYRNRLTRCYLGATNFNRSPSPLTGFDDRDTRGMQISRLLPVTPLGLQKRQAEQAAQQQAAHPGQPAIEAQNQGPINDDEKKQEKEFVPYTGPFPIICTTLNLTFGEDLAWQERKAASFAFTPLYSGYTVGWTSGKKGRQLSFNGFVPTFNYAFGGGGINISTAVAISGAAASPNMGYHTNPAAAFLMTMFDVRLGWWIRNPRTLTDLAGAAPIVRDRPADPGSPWFAPWELAKELLGMTDDTSNYVYLSDGGHFDNMGLYELVRRRCYRILICDGEEDSEYVFEGLGSAIRKCRVDFGVEITLSDLKEIRLDASTGCSHAHFAHGTIVYPESAHLPAGNREGTILYLKSSLTGLGSYELPNGKKKVLCTEPADILNYKLQHDKFPHDPTANQWFTESLFESYRRLGCHVVEEIQTCGWWKDFAR